MTNYLYFDHAASTTVRPQAWKAVTSLQKQSLGNPSSVHTPGRAAKHVIDQARVTLAPLLLVDPQDIIFTSGATEALQTSIIGAYLGLKNKRGVVYTSPLVHSCVWAALDFLQTHHGAKIKLLPITKTGHLDLEKINETLIGESDVIITEHVNSEIGVMQPAAKLGKKLLRYAEETKQAKPVYIVDAAASSVSELIGLDFFKCELLAFSGEKFGALSGTGVLLKSKNVTLKPVQGGSQEWGYRGGTENVVGISAFSAAYQEHHQNLETQNQQLKKIGDLVRTFLKNQKLQIITPKEGSALHILHFLLLENEASLFMAQADLAGVALSAGSACSSGSVEGSKALINLGLSEDEALQGIRISWGWDTSIEQAESLCERLKQLL